MNDHLNASPSKAGDVRDDVLKSGYEVERFERIEIDVEVFKTCETLRQGEAGQLTSHEVERMEAGESLEEREVRAVQWILEEAERLETCEALR